MVTKKVAVKSIDPFYAAKEFKKYFKTIISRRGYDLYEMGWIVGYSDKYVASQTYLNTKVSLNVIEQLVRSLYLSPQVKNKLIKLARDKNQEITNRQNQNK